MKNNGYTHWRSHWAWVGDWRILNKWWFWILAIVICVLLSIYKET